MMSQLAYNTSWPRGHNDCLRETSLQQNTCIFSQTRGIKTSLAIYNISEHCVFVYNRRIFRPLQLSASLRNCTRLNDTSLACVFMNCFENEHYKSFSSRLINSIPLWQHTYITYIHACIIYLFMLISNKTVFSIRSVSCKIWREPARKMAHFPYFSYNHIFLSQC